MTENVMDLVSTPPPLSPTKITEELIPEQLSVSPLDLCKNVMLEAMKENFNHDRDLQAYIKKIPEIFTTVQKLSTKAPLFDVDGSRLPISQPIQVLQRQKTAVIISSTFQRNPDKEAQVVAHQTTSITPTDPEPHPLAAEPTEGEEEENMEDINR